MSTSNRIISGMAYTIRVQMQIQLEIWKQNDINDICHLYMHVPVSMLGQIHLRSDLRSALKLYGFLALSPSHLSRGFSCRVQASPPNPLLPPFQIIRVVRCISLALHVEWVSHTKCLVRSWSRSVATKQPKCFARLQASSVQVVVHTSIE